MTTAGQEEAKRSSSANWKWIAGTVVLLLCAYATRSGFVVYSLYAILFVMILSRLIVEICLRGFECGREISRTEITIGEKIEVILTIRNKGSLPIPWVFVEEILPDKAPVTGEHTRVLTLLPGQEQKMLYQVTLNRRGYHQIGPALVQAGDLFGFFRRYKTGTSRDYVTVYPSIEHLFEYDISTRRPIGTVKVSNRIFEDPTRIVGVREYAPGDPLNRIHWKTTARMGSLHSKVFEPSRVIGATVVLDFHKNAYKGVRHEEQGELAVMTAASLANYIASANEQIGFFTNGRDLAEVARWESLSLQGKLREQIVGRARQREKSHRLAPFTVPTRRGADQGRLILEALARVDYTDGLTIDTLLLYSLQHISRDSTILVVTPEVTDNMAVAFGIMKEAGFLVNVFLVFPDESEYFSALERLAPHRVDIYHIRSRESISKYATHDIYY